MSTTIDRRAVLAGAASAAVTAPASAAPTPDPIFAAIEAYKLNFAAFLARCHYEDELAEKGIKLASAPDDYRTPEMVALVNASIPARNALAETVPTTAAGLAALISFLREQTVEMGEPFFDRSEEQVAFFETLNTAVRGILARAT
jgi:hypothetical protein